MDASDASLRPVLVAGVAPPEPRVVLFALDVRVLADVVFSTAASVVLFRAAFFFAVETALLFTVDLTGLATDFVVAAKLFEAGLSALLIPFASLPASDFVNGGLPVFEALLLFAVAAVLAADLVAVAFMVSSLNELRSVQPFPCTAMPILADGLACIGCRLRPVSLCTLSNHYFRFPNLKAALVYTRHCSRPLINVSFGRFLPMKTILLPRASFSGHFAPMSLPII